MFVNIFSFTSLTKENEMGKLFLMFFLIFLLRLSTGWSVKTHDLQEYGKKSQSLNEMEQNAIKKVIKRAEILEQREQERVG